MNTVLILPCVPYLRIDYLVYTVFTIDAHDMMRRRPGILMFNLDLNWVYDLK